LIDQGSPALAKDHIEAAQYLIANQTQIEAAALSLLAENGESVERSGG
jgi:hypothetical protein